MKLKKILSFAAAATLAASVVTTTASADFAAVTDPVGGLSSATGLYMVPVFCNSDSGDIPLTDYQLDLSKIGGVSFTIQIPEAEREFFDGKFGGGVGVSIHATNIVKPETVTDADKTMTTPGGKKVTEWAYYNWDNSKEYWGVIDSGAKDPNSYDIDGVLIEGMPEYIVQDGSEKPAFLETLSPYTYRIKTDVVNPIIDGKCKAEDITDIRVFFQGWGDSWPMFKVDVTRTVVFDTDGKVMIAFDQKGNKVDGTADDEKEAVRPTVPSEDDPETSDTASTATSNATSDTASNATSSATSSTTSAATSNTTSAATNSTSSAATNDTTSGTTSSSSSSSGLPTGALIGIIAGVVAVIVVVVVIVVKKKKG